MAMIEPGVQGFGRLSVVSSPSPELSAAEIEHLRTLDAAALTGFDSGRLRARRQQLTDSASCAILDSVLDAYESAKAERPPVTPSSPARRTPDEMAAAMERGRQHGREDREERARRPAFLEGFKALGEV
jgi:hypothetical protein